SVRRGRRRRRMTSTNPEQALSHNEVMWLLVDAALWVDIPDDVNVPMDVDDDGQNDDVIIEGADDGGEEEATSSSSEDPLVRLFPQKLTSSATLTEITLTKAKSGRVVKAKRAPKPDPSKPFRYDICTKPELIGKRRDVKQHCSQVRQVHASSMTKEGMFFRCSCGFRCSGARAATGHLKKCENAVLTLYRTINGTETPVV
ncbi:hypothetical protein PENTCL1PPCAC_10077, partial [Pristionchus entomophagus]